MRKVELERYKRRLLELRSRLRGDVSSVLENSIARSGQSDRSPGDEADAGSDNWDTELALNLSQNDNDTLELIDSALRRIEDGSYGKCIATGNKISKPRLDALPYTPYCVEHAAELEQSAIRKPR